MTVDEYLAKQTPIARNALARVRSVIKKALPRAIESISYGIPAYKVDGRAVIYVSAWKNHWSLYPASTLLRATFAKELASADVEKGTIRFAYDDVRATLITKIAKLRAKETAAAVKPKKRAAKKAARSMTKRTKSTRAKR